MRRGTLRYNRDTDRWYFEDGDYEYDFHCGDSVEIKIGSRYVYGRLEYDDAWYIIFPDARFTMRTKWIYQAKTV